MQKILKKIKLYLSICLFSSIFAILLFELFAAFNKNLFPHFGWQKENKISKKIDQCKDKKNIGVFGDSFVEFYGQHKSNLVQQLQLKFKNYKLCNFGISGTSITTYLRRFNYVLDQEIKLNKAIFFFYEGNDFDEFRYFKNLSDLDNPNILSQDIFDYNSTKNIDRELHFIKNFVKSTYTLNIFYRYFIKNIFRKKIDSEYLQNLYNQNLYYEVPYTEALKRLESTPLEYKNKFASGILNEAFYQLALRNPNHAKEIFYPDDERFIIQKKIIFNHIKFINSNCEKKKIVCKIIIIPNDQFLFEESKIKNNKIFRFNFQKDYGQSRVVKDLVLNFKNVFYPKDIFSFSDFLKNDMHLNYNGNKKLAKFVFNLEKN